VLKYVTFSRNSFQFLAVFTYVQDVHKYRPLSRRSENMSPCKYKYINVLDNSMSVCVCVRLRVYMYI